MSRRLQGYLGGQEEPSGETPSEGSVIKTDKDYSSELVRIAKHLVMANRAKVRLGGY